MKKLLASCVIALSVIALASCGSHSTKNVDCCDCDSTCVCACDSCACDSCACDRHAAKVVIDSTLNVVNDTINIVL